MGDSLLMAQVSTEAAKEPPPLFRSPKRIDWGTNQTESEDSTADKDFNAQDDIFTTPPSKQVRSGTPTPKSLAIVPKDVDVPTSSRVYDIPTLLRLSGSLAGIGVFAKVKPEALAGKTSTSRPSSCPEQCLTFGVQRICFSTLAQADRF